MTTDLAENVEVRLAARPVGMPKSTDWSITRSPIPQPAEGECLVEVTHLSLDPAMRGWMNAGKSYLPPVEIGAVMRARGIGRVKASRSPKLQVGDWVTGDLGVRGWATVPAEGVRKLDPTAAPLPVQLGILGMTGMTAYFGLLDVGKPVAGETVVVSGAAGAVGMAVGQIAKIKGCRTVGIAGGPEKTKFLVDELGFDAAIDYKSTSETVHQALKRTCPKGIDVYFDNVGGEILEAALANLAMHARIVICGAISQYNSTAPAGPRNYMSLLVNRARMEGMLVMDYGARYGEAAREMLPWLREGKLKSREDVVRGTIDQFPTVFLKLFSGENFGKLILQVAD